MSKILYLGFEKTRTSQFNFFFIVRNIVHWALHCMGRQFFFMAVWLHFLKYILAQGPREVTRAYTWSAVNSCLGLFFITPGKPPVCHFTYSMSLVTGVRNTHWVFPLYFAFSLSFLRFLFEKSPRKKFVTFDHASQLRQYVVDCHFVGGVVQYTSTMCSQDQCKVSTAPIAGSKSSDCPLHCTQGWLVYTDHHLNECRAVRSGIFSADICEWWHSYEQHRNTIYVSCDADLHYEGHCD